MAANMYDSLKSVVHLFTVRFKVLIAGDQDGTKKYQRS